MEVHHAVLPQQALLAIIQHNKLVMLKGDVHGLMLVLVLLSQNVQITLL
jgi:hypothetical protein